MILLEKDFLTLFKRDKNISEKDFLEKYKVKTSNDIYNLNDYIQKKK